MPPIPIMIVLCLIGLVVAALLWAAIGAVVSPLWLKFCEATFGDLSRSSKTSIGNIANGENDGEGNITAAQVFWPFILLMFIVVATAWAVFFLPCKAGRYAVRYTTRKLFPERVRP